MLFRCTNGGAILLNKPKSDIHVAIISLGCSKNLVDSECMTRILLDDHMIMVSDPSEAEVIVVNTCGFIESAKTEAIDTILEMAEYKTTKGMCDFLVVTGCLAQRYENDIRKDLPEVDQILGTGHYDDISQAIRGLYGENEKSLESYVDAPGSLSHMRSNRVVSTQTYAWLKIAEGCSNCCSYCAIPMIRGPYRSRKMEDIVQEASFLAESGSSEIILTAQDTTRYGLDLYGKRMLPELIRKISMISSVRMIRIMYTYSDGITDELVLEMSQNPKVAHYLDMPVQHGDDRVLAGMNRHDTTASITASIQRLREKIPDIVLRTTVMVGFPGETKEAFDNLMKQLDHWQFDRLGCFVFSPEENTAAFDMKAVVSKSTAQMRFEKVMTRQKTISLERNRQRLHQISDVTIESVSDDGIFYMGRSYGEAPDVDPAIYVVATEEPLQIGKSYPVRFVDFSEYDLTGVVEI
jgi:ribosomal protein S12 methylthiotransferase